MLTHRFADHGTGSQGSMSQMAMWRLGNCIKLMVHLETPCHRMHWLREAGWYLREFLIHLERLPKAETNNAIACADRRLRSPHVRGMPTQNVTKAAMQKKPTKRVSTKRMRPSLAQ